MQITIKSVKIIKEGTRQGGGAYKWCSVMAEDGSEKGTEYTTFDAGVLKLGPGSVIDIGEMVVKEGKLSFKKVESIISAASAIPTAQPGSNGKNEGTRAAMSPEDWAEKDRLERFSIESSTAFKGIMGVVGPQLIAEDPQCVLSHELDKVYKEALKWAERHFTEGQVISTPIVKNEKSTKKKGKEKTGITGLWPEGGFKDKGHLLTHASLFGISTGDLFSAVDVKSADEIIDLDEAWGATVKQFKDRIDQIYSQ